MSIFKQIETGPIDKYGDPNGRYGRVSVTDRSKRHLWEYRHPGNLDSNGWSWGKSSLIENGTVKVGDIVAIFNDREPGYLRCSVGGRIPTTTRREVAAVLIDDDGTLRIKCRKIGSDSTGKGYRQYGTSEYAIMS